MTAEIAILNRLAVALAADSAVSIGRPPNLKIYNTVNKIFELSGHHPVGIMVYGRLDFMGVPYEPLIKEYRKKLGTKTFSHISDYRDDFKKHLAKEIPFSDQDARQNVAAVLTESFAAANKQIDYLVRQDMLQRGSFQKSKINGIAQEYLRSQTSALKTKPFAPKFTRRQLPSDYVTLVDTLINSHFLSNMPNATTKRLLRYYAQEDMIKSFLDGIDPSVNEYIRNLLEGGIRKTADMIAGLIYRDETKEQAFKKFAAKRVDSIVDDMKKSIEKHTKEFSADPIRDMVNSMPKQELATLASSLIEITSLKRKVSRDQETVGGEVDVAIISKSEGFIWIKRKHYFPPELNRRFLIRQEQQVEERSK